VLHNKSPYPIKCHDLHLREITINDYRGRKQVIHIARFFIQNARVLKVLRFGIKYRYNKIWWNIQFKWLDWNKASRYTDFQFRHLPYLYKFGYGDVKRTNLYGLSVAHPFARLIDTSRATGTHIRCSMVYRKKLVLGLSPT
jgi:hypothetical protein